MSRSFNVRIQIGILVILLSLGFAAGSLAAENALDSEATDDAQSQAEPKRKGRFADTPCAKDHEQMCGHTKGWRLGFECLRARKKIGTLSQECADHTDEITQARFEKAHAMQRAWQDACAEEIVEHCSQYEKSMTISGCLQQVRDQVSEACSAKLPRRASYIGPGYLGWKDGSEPANFDEKRRKKLRPKQAQDAENQQAADEQRQHVRDAVRAQLAERQRLAAEGGKSESADPPGATDEQ